jgi:hypothetical protein
MEGMYAMLAAFVTHKIDAIFVFDGKPPEEKTELLKQRKNNKFKNNERRKKLLDQYDMLDDKTAAKNEIHLLNKQCATINKTKTDNVIQLIASFGMKYCVAQGEADQVCASMVLNGDAWACLSEDTDMFVYSCPRVLRYFNIINYTISLYNFKQILDNLSLSEINFKKMCILSGTDYNIEHNAKMFLSDIWKRYTSNNINSDFYEWYKSEYDGNVLSYEKMQDLISIFELTPSTQIELPISTELSKNNIINIMDAHNFIFMPH